MTALTVCAVQAVVDDVDFSGVQIATAALTNSAVVRGKVEGVYISAPSLATGTVVITAAHEGVLFKGTNLTGSAYYPMQYPAYWMNMNTIAEYIVTGVMSNSAGGIYYTTNRFPMSVASKVTRVLTGECATTNTWTINLNVTK